MPLTKITNTGLADDAVTSDKVADGVISAADVADGTLTNAKLVNSGITINGTSIALGASGDIVAGTDWQTVKTTDFNAVAGEGYFVDTNSVGAVTATLPGSPSAGDTIAFKDYAGTFGTNNLTIGRNGNNIQGEASDSLISTNRASVVLVYIDATKGWLYTNESNISIEPSTFITATGGTITESGDFKIHTFTGDGTFVVSQTADDTPVAPNNVDYLVVAGGGGGASLFGGGGAGGFREGRVLPAPESYIASPLVAPAGLPVSVTTYPVTVGGGGAGGPLGLCQSPGVNGSNSVFSTITSAGGGGGGGAQPSGGLPGGSGGGGPDWSGSGQPGGTGNTPPTSPPQGNNGGDATSTNAGGGGGGGATAAGANGGANTGGNGGAGATSSINGTPTARSGGGGGGIYTGNPGPKAGGTGGTGGGGNGGTAPAGSGSIGTINTGGGGGGGSRTGCCAAGGAGGSGIVIIRYKFQ